MRPYERWLKKHSWPQFLFFAGLTVTVFCSSAFAADIGGASSEKTAAETSSPPAEQPIDYTGDRISYDQAKNILRGDGHVLITHKNMSLKADRVIAYLETSDAYADGNVVLTVGNQVFTGEKVHFNFKTRMGDFINGTGFVDPWYGKGKVIRRTGANEYQIMEGYVTSCGYDEPHYKIKAQKIYIYPKERLIAKNVTFSLGGIDLLWSPLFSRSLKDERQRFSFIPGYNRRLGAFLRSGYNFWFDPYLTGTVHADVYGKRGFGTGVDVQYDIGPTAIKTPMKGNLKSYFIDDDNFQPTQTIGVNTEDPRYRVSLEHEQQIFSDTRLLSEVHALSDPDIVNDFFRDDFEKDVQPETFVDLAKNTENYRLALFMRKRINKIFTTLERLPELQFSTRTLPIGETGLYYTTTNSGGYLRQLPLEAQRYDSIRLDTLHELSYPFKVLKFLNLEPKVGLRETFWTKDVDKDDTFRTLVTLSFDTFTKLHRRWDNVESKFWDIHQLRHVIEPRITYTFTPIPTKRPSQLLQFDGIDALDRQNFFRYGIRQILQTRRQDQTFDVVDADVFLFYFPNSNALTTDRFGKERHLSNLFLESRFRPLDWVAFDLRGGYDMFNTEINEVLLDVAFIAGDKWNVSLRQRQKVAENNLTALEILYRFSEDWIGKAFWRYDFEFSRLEMQEYTLLRDLHCWEVALTFRQRQLRDDLSLFVIFRLKDYPGVPIRFGN